MTTRIRWSPSALQTLDGCARRFALREAKWAPKPDPLRPAAPHAQFGRIWHAGAEVFDRAMFAGETRDQATDAAMDYAINATWDTATHQPWAGDAVDEWRCDKGKIPSEITGRPVQCPGSKGWWLDDGNVHVCTKCGGPAEKRVALVPHHPTKNRTMLLRAVLDYCDEALEGVADVATLVGSGGLPGLEVDLSFRLGGLNLHCILDRYTQMGTTYLAHERKSSSRYPFWDGYLQTYQVRLYPEALRQNGLRCDGVLIEHYQIQNGGTRRATTILNPGPDHTTEAIEAALRTIDAVEKWDGHDPLDYPPSFSHCAHAAGGQPCEFLKVCTGAQSRRHERLVADFEQRERTHE